MTHVPHVNQFPPDDVTCQNFPADGVDVETMGSIEQNHEQRDGVAWWPWSPV